MAVNLAKWMHEFFLANILCFRWIYSFFLILILLQELNLAEAVVNRLQTVSLRFCGAADQALPRLRGALSAGRILLFILLHKFYDGTYTYHLLQY
jgi:hypothetical protein